MQNKVIQTDLGIFTHIMAYSGIFRNYSDIVIHIPNPVLPWRIQNPGIFRNLAYSEPQA